MQINCKAGSPCPHVPTALTKALVKNLYALGISKAKISGRLHIDEETLSKHYKEELQEGLDNMNVVAMNRLYAKVEEGHYKSIISWLKMRAGWKEAGSESDSDKDRLTAYLLDQLHKQEKDNEEL